MTLKEFLEKNPAAIEEAAKCENVDEFKNLIEKAGITFESEDKLQKAFELVKNKNVTELSEDALDSVSGGSKARVIKDSDVFVNHVAHKVYSTSKGKKV